MRERLELSAPTLATILGVSAQSVYNWEQGTSRPNKEMIGNISILKKMGKRCRHEVRCGLMDQHKLWSERYRAAGEDYLFGIAPNLFLAHRADRLREGCTALSVADGEGRNWGRGRGRG